MGKTEFATAIISKLKSAIGNKGSEYGTDTAALAMAAVAEAITEYLIANTEVAIAYEGIMTSPPNPKDPVIMDKFKIIGTCSPPGSSSHFDSWIKQIEANIIAGFQLAPLGERGVAFAIKPFAKIKGVTTTRNILEGKHDVSDRNPQLKIWETVCEGILNWMNSSEMNVTPGTAGRVSGPSTGVAQITKIKVS